MTAKRVEVSVGALMRKTNSTNWIWQVVEFVTPSGHQPHARLMRVNNPSDMRMFAVAALNDRSLFVDADDPLRRLKPDFPIQWSSQLEA